MLMGAAFVTNVSAADEVSAVKRTIEDFYSVYYVDLDKKRYLSLLTDDYLLLENGEVMNADDDIALMPTPEDEYKRTDKFDFRKVKVHGDTAYTVHVLKSDITDKKNGNRKREYLESAILRRSGKRWRVALLHSTKITKPA